MARETGKVKVERFGPTRRGGPVFRWLGEPLAIDLANTIMVVRDSEEIDLLATQDDLLQWLDAERDRLGGYRVAVTHLAEIRDLRDAIRAVLMTAATGGAPPSSTIEWLNAASAAAPIAPQLAYHESGLLLEERSATPAPLARLLGQLSRSAISILTNSDREPLRVCMAPSCGMFYLGARRWCCAACGNRARAARHYQRTKHTR